jgi:DNA-binding winged helix-turn-helix (wHTH) protein
MRAGCTATRKHTVFLQPGSQSRSGILRSRMRVRFGAFVMDSSTRELLSGTGPVPLSPKAFQLLLLLVEQRPRALTKTELYDSLWPNAFVVDANLVNLMAEIRNALGDNPREPHFIRTVHRFGYAFCAKATEEPARGSLPAGATPSFTLTWRGGKASLADGTYVIGRESGVPIRIPSESVSRKHLRIRVAGDTATIEDLGSKNGTFVRGERITESKSVTDGETFVAGSVRITFHVIIPTRATRTVDTGKN